MVYAYEVAGSEAWRRLQVFRLGDDEAVLCAFPVYNSTNTPLFPLIRKSID